MTVARTLLAAEPWVAVLVFVAASLLLVWTLDRMAEHGLEGTALGTLAMPWCSGLGNLLFVAFVVRDGHSGAEVAVNALVNNVTSLTLLLGLPALVWGLDLAPGRRRSKKVLRAFRINRLSLLLSLAAAGCFAGVLWALASDGRLDRGDGAALVVLFLFWQCFQVYDVLKTHVQHNRKLNAWLGLDTLALLAAGAGIYVSVEAITLWLGTLPAGTMGGCGAGWITGWVMVLPNALLAFHYGRRGQADVVFSSQLGDGHICIPLCIGLAALAQPFDAPAMLGPGLAVLGAATAVHAVVLAWSGGLPRSLGLGLAGAYGVFLAVGLA